MNLPILSLLVLVPAIVGFLTILRPLGVRNAQLVSFVVTAAIALASLTLALLASGNSGLMFTERYNWLRLLGLEYHLGIDGIGLVFFILTPVVIGMSLGAAARYSYLDRKYYGLMLLLMSGLLGTFTAQNFLHFFFFWELSIIPAFFLIRSYGGTQRSYAATQFFLFTMVGSIAMLIGFAAIYAAVGTFDFAGLAELRGSETFGALLQQKLQWTAVSDRSLSVLIFLLVFAGVAVKVPIWPLHSWQPLAYSEALTPVTMALTGIMSKMGIYALIRIVLPLFPTEIHELRAPLLALAAVTILYGAFAAFSERDIKRLFAYSSLSHTGYCFLGVFAASNTLGYLGAADDRAGAVNGVILQALSHGIIATALFAFISFLERRSNGAPDLEKFGGLRSTNPQFAGLMGIVLFASLGLPGLSGFPAEFLIFKGSFSAAPLASAIAILGLLLAAAYILRFFGAIFYGPVSPAAASSPDLSRMEKCIVLPAVGLALLLGILPNIAVQLFNGTVSRIVLQLGI